MTDQHLFIFNIGPVQGFIAEARRTRDLFVGSRLLVELTRAAAKAVDGIDGVDWVYPGSVDQDSLPNRFVVFVPADRVDQACQAAEEAVKDAWADYAKDARAKLAEFAPREEDQTWEAIWDRQTSAFPEIYWSVCAPPTPADVVRLLGHAAASGILSPHAAHYTIASLLLNARKGMRRFGQTVERGEKDTLSGTREPLHIQDLNARNYWRKVSENLMSRGNPSLVRPGGRERLDALGAVKRFIPPQARDFPGIEKFPSTSSVAAADFRRRIEKNQAAFEALGEHGKLAVLRRVFRPGDGFAANIGLASWDYDGDLLYDSTFTPQTFEDDYGLKVTKEDLEPARESLRRLYHAADCQPSTYYAILRMDADEMSEKIASCQSREEHQKISQALSKFARQVLQIVEGEIEVQVSATQKRKLAGRVVYAGGDDVLALLPVADVLPAAAALREAFCQVFHELAIEETISETFRELVLGATISAGIALVHHRHPLDGALRVAREAEHAAKQMSSKDALCVYALKRSGEAVRVQAKWEYDSVGSVPELIETMRSLFVADGPLSPRFAYEAHTEARGLALDRSAHTVPREALEKELGRLLTRHLDPEKVERPAQEKPGEAMKRVAQELAEPLAQLGQALDAHRGEWKKKWDSDHPGSEPDPLDEDYAPQPGAIELGKWLLLARFLAMGGEE